MKKVGILGATGSAGIEFVHALVNHPWFELTELYASDKSAEKTLEEACMLNIRDIPIQIRKMRVRGIDDVADVDFLCSALPSEIAKKYEEKYAAQYPVISTTSAYRYEADVPILITEVNSNHASLLQTQQNRGWKGWIAPGPNCTTVGLVMSLYPLYRAVGIERVVMSSYQSVSGGGYKLIKNWEEQKRDIIQFQPQTPDHRPQTPDNRLLVQPPFHIADNVIGYIEKEEEKVKNETKKILHAEFSVDCQCVRVPTLQGHFETVFVELKKTCSVEAVKVLYEEFNQECKENYGHLPSSPQKTIHVLERSPQPLFDSFVDGGMSVIVGRIEKGDWGKNTIKYQVLSNNVVKGAAKGMIQVAEWLYTNGMM